MANVLINEDTMTAIADAIRAKKSVSTTYLPSEMPDAIASISGGGITPTGTKQISITQNGTTTEDVTNYASAQITVNVQGGGGGSSNLETGSVTLSSDLSLTTSAQAIPNLTLGFQPDFFLLLPDRASFEGRETYGGGLWGVVAIKKSWCAPFAFNTTKTPETETGDYVYFVSTALFANTSITCGQGLSGLGLLDTAYYARYAINADGTIGVGRYSTGATKMFAGKYNYIACKF